MPKLKAKKDIFENIHILKKHNMSEKPGKFRAESNLGRNKIEIFF